MPTAGAGPAQPTTHPQPNGDRSSHAFRHTPSVTSQDRPVSAARAKGTAWESAIVAYLRGRGFPFAERRALAGANDLGDITGIPGIVIEAKNQNRQSLAGWLDEATVERDNANARIGVAWFKRRGKTSPGAGYVLMDGATFTDLLRLAGWGDEQ